MARVIFQNQQINDQVAESVHIPFGSDKSLELTEAECIKMAQLLSFERRRKKKQNKKQQRSEPPRKPNVTDLFKSRVCLEYDQKDTAWVMLRCLSRSAGYCNYLTKTSLFACRLQAASSWIGIVIPSSLVAVLNHGSRC